MTGLLFHIFYMFLYIYSRRSFVVFTLRIENHKAPLFFSRKRGGVVFFLLGFLDLPLRGCGGDGMMGMELSNCLLVKI